MLTKRIFYSILHLPVREIARENGPRAKVAKGQNLKGTALSSSETEKHGKAKAISQREPEQYQVRRRPIYKTEAYKEAANLNFMFGALPVGCAQAPRDERLGRQAGRLASNPVWR